MIRFIATDLDGTLIDHDEGPEEYAAFLRAVVGVRQHGGKWCIITGRHLGAMQTILQEFYYKRLVPDYLVVEDARVYTVRSPLRFCPHWFWNAKIDTRRFLLNLKHRRILRDLSAELQGVVPEAESRSRPGIDIWLHCPHEEQAERVEAFLHGRTVDLPDYLLFRWGTEVCLSPGIGTKADALARLQAKLNLHPSEIFAVGDGANDVPMLQSPMVGWAACVGNAADSVRATIERRGGYAAAQNGLRGVLEALEATAQPTNQNLPHEQPTSPPNGVPSID